MLSGYKTPIENFKNPKSLIIVGCGVMNKISDLYGRKIYTQDSTYIGVAKDVLIDPVEGKIKYLLKADAQSILGREDAEAKKFIRENFIPFERVVATGDIIIVR